MHRCGSGLCLTIAIIFALALSGCLGGSTSNSPNGGVKSVTLNPASDFSMDVGASQVFSASAADANGRPIVGTVHFFVQSGTPGSPSPLSVATNGNACAGNWDAQVAICNPGTPGIALVTATVNGVSSPPTTVYVHLHVDSIQVSNAEQTQPPFDCFSQGQSWNYQATAYNQGLDITNTVGPMSWAFTNTSVITTRTLLPNQPLNQVEITAASPGITGLFASISGTTSNTLPINTCLVQYIRLQVQGLTSSSTTVNTGTPLSLQATVVDTLGVTLAKPPLTWATNNPEVVSFSSLANTTGSNTATARANLGGADITASCTPPSCNIGVVPGMPVYASGGQLSPTNKKIGYGTISINVTTNSKPPAYTGVAATDMCGNAPGCLSSVFTFTPGNTNPITAILTAPRTPNSFLFNFQSSPRLYLGSDQGLMYSDLGSAGSVTPVSASTTPCNVSLCGVVKAISNDGKLVVVSDDVSTTPQVYIFNSSNNGSTDLVLPNVVTAAAFSPDQSKVFLLTDAGTLYVYSTVDALAPVPLSGFGTDVSFSPDSSIAYVGVGNTSQSGSVYAFSTCAVPGVPSTNLGFVPASVSPLVAPLQIFPSPNVQADQNGITQNIYVLEPPSVQVMTAVFTQTPINDGQFTCNVPTLLSFTPGATINLSQGPFIPLYARLVADGSQMVIVAKKNPSVLIFNIANGTTTSVPLLNNGDPLAASSSTDGGTVFVAACDQYQPDGVTCAAGSVHIVNTLSQGDYTQVPFINNNTNNMCNNLGGSAPLCVADLVAVKPQ